MSPVKQQGQCNSCTSFATLAAAEAAVASAMGVSNAFDFSEQVGAGQGRPAGHTGCPALGTGCCALLHLARRCLEPALPAASCCPHSLMADPSATKRTCSPMVHVRHRTAVPPCPPPCCLLPCRRTSTSATPAGAAAPRAGTSQTSRRCWRSTASWTSAACHTTRLEQRVGPRPAAGSSHVCLLCLSLGNSRLSACPASPGCRLTWWLTVQWSQLLLSTWTS